MAAGFKDDVAKERLPEEMSLVTQLSFDDIGIDDSRLLGKGAFSSVYAGTMKLSKDSEETVVVAIKKMKIPAIMSKVHKYLSTELRVLR
jgi:hypothetical protein